MTYNELIKSSLRLTGRLGVGRTYGQSELADAQFVLNSFLDGCNADGSLIYTRSIVTNAAIPQQSPITMGPGGDWDVDRPEKITLANVLLDTDPANRRKLNLLTDEQWAAKAIHEVYSIPVDLYADGAWPLTNLYFYPIPDTAYSIELYVWQLLHQVTDFTAAASFPPGYEEFLRYNLAVRLAAEFGQPVRADVLELARESKAKIQSMNIVIPRLGTEPGLGGRRTVFNYLSRERS